MKNLICTILFAGIALSASAQQRSVAITIDDVPNVHLFEASSYSSGLLRRLDSLNVPVAIFINEGNLRLNKAFEKNRSLLQSWISKRYVTVGNHSYSHPNMGEVGFDVFREQVLKGEELSRPMAVNAGKNLEYFRFPFNGMGKDSVEQMRMQQFLTASRYISTPYTVESEDWLYTQLYEKALKDGKPDEARAIGNRYVSLSLRLFDYFDSLAVAVAGKPVRQIYLCHDNRLNTDFLPALVQKLKQKEYRFIDLAEAMSDPAYGSYGYYYGNAGFSWVYRWMKDPASRRAAMRAEPSDPETQRAYEAMNKGK